VRHCRNRDDACQQLVAQQRPSSCRSYCLLRCHCALPGPKVVPQHSQLGAAVN
jgi:hypothetical protein